MVTVDEREEGRGRGRRVRREGEMKMLREEIVENGVPFLPSYVAGERKGTSRVEEKNTASTNPHAPVKAPGLASNDGHQVVVCTRGYTIDGWHRGLHQGEVAPTPPHAYRCSCT
jgi:hypothetical protein